MYQASFLIRDYNFKPNEFVFDENGMLINKDPKIAIAEKQGLKVDLENASFHQLIRVPGIGKKIALKFLKTRNIALLPKKSLKFIKTKNNLLNFLN